MEPANDAPGSSPGSTGLVLRIGLNNLLPARNWLRWRRVAFRHCCRNPTRRCRTATIPEISSAVRWTGVGPVLNRRYGVLIVGVGIVWTTYGGEGFDRQPLAV